VRHISMLRTGIHSCCDYMIITSSTKRITKVIYSVIYIIYKNRNTYYAEDRGIPRVKWLSVLCPKILLYEALSY
jgi:hypothetical protein